MTDTRREPEEPKERSSRALPNSRLNPLLNPLLAQQLGRWAHIYYTAPVDKRESAVEELLRELEAEAAKIAAAGNTPAAAAPAALEPFVAEPEVAAEPIRSTQVIRDDEELELSAEMQEPPTSLPFREAPIDENPPQDLLNADPESGKLPWPTLGLRNIQRAEPHESEAGSIALAPITDPMIMDPMTGANAPSASERFAALMARGTARAWQLRPQSLVVATSLVLVIGTVLWIAHRSIAQIAVGHQGSVAQGPVAQGSVASGGAAGSPAARPATASGTLAIPPASLPKRPGTTADLAATTVSQRASGPEASRRSEAPNGGTTGQTSQRAIMVSDKKGDDADDDLATGLRYLHGDGVERDSEAAVHHLWKAVSKHNGPALVVLAGLYAQGDGVDKNCDQARILILAAARQKTQHVETALETLHRSGCE